MEIKRGAELCKWRKTRGVYICCIYCSFTVKRVRNGVLNTPQAWMTLHWETHHVQALGGLPPPLKRAAPLPIAFWIVLFWGLVLLWSLLFRGFCCCLSSTRTFCDSQHLWRFNLNTLLQGKEFSSCRTPSLSVSHPIVLATWPYIFIWDTLSTCLILYQNSFCKPVLLSVYSLAPGIELAWQIKTALK